MFRMMLISSFLTLALPAASVDDIFQGAPPVPPGYENDQQVRDAIMKGEVPMLLKVPEPPATMTVTKDVVYASPDGKDLKLDLFVPKEAKTPPPVLLFIHGGGWSKGKKEDYLYYNIKFTELGYATASMQYRLSPESHFPAAIQDVHCAIAWLAEHGSKHGFDGDRIALVGGSAGGHLSLLAGYSQDEALECPGKIAEEEPIKAIVNLYGVVDCTTPKAQSAHQVNDFIGKPYEEAKETYAMASPIHHLDKTDPPTLTLHGTIDSLVPISQADNLHAKLEELGIPNYLDRVEGWPHTMDLAKPINDRCRYLMEKFLAIHLPLDEQ